MKKLEIIKPYACIFRYKDIPTQAEIIAPQHWKHCVDHRQQGRTATNQTGGFHITQTGNVCMCVRERALIYTMILIILVFLGIIPVVGLSMYFCDQIYNHTTTTSLIANYTICWLNTVTRRNWE